MKLSTRRLRAACLAAGLLAAAGLALAQGYPAKPKGTNTEGLRRRGFTPEQILAVRRAYKTLYREGLTLEAAREKIERDAANAPVLAPLAAFLAVAGRGIVR